MSSDKIALIVGGICILAILIVPGCVALIEAITP